MLPTLSSFFLYCSLAQFFFLFLKRLYRNKSAAYKWICSDIPSACKQHRAAKSLQEIKELGYVGKGVHWRQSSCFRLLNFHLPPPPSQAWYHGSSFSQPSETAFFPEPLPHLWYKTSGICLCCIIAIEHG